MATYNCVPVPPIQKIGIKNITKIIFLILGNPDRLRQSLSSHVHEHVDVQVNDVHILLTVV